MKYNIEIEIDESAVKESGIGIEEYLRREMGWLENSGIMLSGMSNPEVIPGQDYSLEHRGGVDWHIAYAHDGAATTPISGYVQEKGSANRLIEVNHVEGTGLTFGEFVIKEGFEVTKGFETFDEALDAANRYIYRQHSLDTDRYPIHGLSGNEGIYHLGTKDGVDYVANAFWSEEEPGYVNHGVFAIRNDEMEVLTSGFYNGYLTIEDCVRDLASDFTPLENPNITFEAYCSWEFDTADEYRASLHEGRLDEPIPVPSWGQIADDNQALRSTPKHEELMESISNKVASLVAEKPDGKETFYFSFGTSEHFPFKHGGWVEVRAKDRMEACELYSSHYPKRDGLINCAFVYDEREWKQSGMDREVASGHVCHQVIDSWGPHSGRGHARAELLAVGFEENLIDQRSDVPRQISPEMGSKLLGLHYKLEPDDMKVLCPGVFWCYDDKEEVFAMIDNRGDDFLIKKFSSDGDFRDYLDGLSPLSGWEERYGVENLDAKVNALAEKTVCPVMPDPELSDWDMCRYGYERSGMLPVGAEKAQILFDKVPLHCLHPDGFSTPVQNGWEVEDHAEKDGLFGVTTVSWMEYLADTGIVRVEETPLWQALYGPDEMSLDDLTKRARERAAERNGGRSEELKARKPPEMGR